MSETGATETGATGTVRGGLAGLGGGLLICLAYLMLPAGAMPGGGPLTASQLGDMMGSMGPSSLGLLSMVPFLAVVIFSIGGWFSIVKPAEPASRMGGVALLACAGLAAVTYVLPLVQVLAAVGLPLGPSSLEFTRSGFWLTLLGVIVTAGGGWLQLSGSRDA